MGKGTRDSAEVVRAAADAVLLDDDLLARRPGEVSDGQLQRAIVARGIAQRPAFFICDEPTSMLDPITTAAIVAALRDIAAGGAGVLLISHDLRLLRAVADRGYVVEGGKVTPDRELAG
nr:ATP-binding cassette domain-containing protein [Corynebacterium lactis]